MQTSPLVIGLVFGGRSGEHEVSICSARTIAGALTSGENSKRYILSLHYISRSGHWFSGATAAAALAGDGTPDEAGQSVFQLPAEAAAVDVWFPVLHGPNGEDGTIQGLFTMAGRPFVGSGVLGSAVGMDKSTMKAVFASTGLPIGPYVDVAAKELVEPDVLLHRIEHSLGYPCFVKPANQGSSLGISKAHDRKTLLDGLHIAAKLDSRLLVEAALTMRELECAVIGDTRLETSLEASVVGEILYDSDWYDYRTKYLQGLSRVVIPAELPATTTRQIQHLAVEAARVIGVSGLSRVDFFYEPDQQKIYLNEINTMPGFTSQSMFPMLWEATGLPLEHLVHRLVGLALARHSPTTAVDHGESSGGSTAVALATRGLCGSSDTGLDREAAA